MTTHTKDEPKAPTQEAIFGNHDKQFTRFAHYMLLTYLMRDHADQDESLGEKSYDLFENAARAFDTHAMMTALGFLIVDKNMNFTPRQFTRLGAYLESTMNAHNRFRKRANEMAQIFLDELEESGFIKSEENDNAS